MKVEKFSRFEKLDAGQWLSDCSGVYKVVEPFNENTRCIRAAEVLFNPVDGVPTTDNGDGFISIKKSYFSEDISSYNKLNLASLAELKAELKIDKANNVGIDTGKKKKTPIYAFGISADEYNSKTPVVNLQYLIDIVEAMPNAKAVCKTDKYGFSVVYFIDDEDNRAILLPLRYDKEYKEILSRKVVK